jgi:hypothetical protein
MTSVGGHERDSVTLAQQLKNKTRTAIKQVKQKTKIYKGRMTDRNNRAKKIFTGASASVGSQSMQPQ